MKITDAMLEHYARTGLEALSETFEEDGVAPNAVMLINEAGQFAFVEYPNEGTRVQVVATALKQHAVAAVLIGEGWYREVASQEEYDQLENRSLAEDPLAGEELFAIAMRAGSVKGFRVSRKICRHDDGTTTLVDRQDGWADGTSWLLESLNKIQELVGKIG